MKKNASLGDLAGYCKLFSGLMESPISEEIYGYGVVFAAKVQEIGRMENIPSVVK
jgi:hypothetical protein